MGADVEECRTWNIIILTDCGLTEDIPDAIKTALPAVEGIRGEAAAATMEDRLRAAFREMGYENDSERKVRKVLGKLHDNIKRVLSDQRSAIQTHAALPSTYSGIVCTTNSSVVKPLGTCARHVAFIDKSVSL